jgi:hypothetical protein
MYLSIRRSTAALTILLFSPSALAQNREPGSGSRALHGPAAPDRQFPSHVFSLAAHTPERVQLAFHSGISQPVFLSGFNAAVDVRFKRLVLTYSHGQGLNPSAFLTDSEKEAGVRLFEPFSTGGGVGVLLIDELWLLADVKVHQFEVSTPTEQSSYTTVTVGAELGWRYFIWKGLNLGVVARYWPNVYASSGEGVTLRDAQGDTFVHKPMEQGFGGFVFNALAGWAFEL